MLVHIQRHRNEVIFMKCSDSSCSHCTQNPVKAKKLFAMLKKMDMKNFAPLPKGNTGHYYTFKEMCTEFRARKAPYRRYHLLLDVILVSVNIVQLICFFQRLRKPVT